MNLTKNSPIQSTLSCNFLSQTAATWFLNWLLFRGQVQNKRMVALWLIGVVLMRFLAGAGSEECESTSSANTGVELNAVDSTALACIKFANFNSGSNGAGINAYTTGENDENYVTVRQCTFEGNRAASGAGIHGRQVTFTIDKCIFKNCVATQDGGAIHLKVISPITVTGCEFTSCRATGKGGVVCVRNADDLPNLNKRTGETTFTGCTVSKCTANALGAALYLVGISGLNITGSKFNCAISEGSASTVVNYIEFNDTLEALTIENCVFNNTEGIEIESFMRLQGPDDAAPANSLEYVTCSFEGISATSEGGAGISGSGITLSVNNCNFTSLSCSSETGGVAISGTDLLTLTITDCLFEGISQGTAIGSVVASCPTVTMSGCTFTHDADTSAIVSIKLTSLTTATFKGCCFVGKTRDSAGLYVSLEGAQEAKATFTDTCFDLPKDQSISEGTVSITYTNEEEYTFEKCQCNPYEALKPTSEEELESSSEEDDQDGETSPSEEDGDGDATSSTDDGDEGDGDATSSTGDETGGKPGPGDNTDGEDPTNVPMIVGIVVGVVVVVAVVAVLLFFFVFRKRRNDDQTSDDVDDFGNETASSFAETVELSGETSTPAETNVNSLFQAAARHEFSDVFEEAKDDE